jgi:hypothetical protein
MIYKIPPRQSVGKDYSAYWDNFLTNEEINKILAMPEWINTTKACVGGSSVDGKIVEKIRTTDKMGETKEIRYKIGIFRLR